MTAPDPDPGLAGSDPGLPASAWRRRLTWILKRLAVASLVLVGLLVVGLLWLTQTRSGRAQLLRLVVGQVNAAIPGHLEVAELGRLDWSGARLRAVSVADPAGREVAHVDHLGLEYDLFALWNRQYLVTKVELVGGEVDLRDLTADRPRLVAAFVDPDAPPAPPRTAPLPSVRVDRVQVRDLAVRLPSVTHVGQVDVRHIDFDGGFELDGTPSATVSELSAELLREGETLATLEQVTASLARGSEPSQLSLQLSLPPDTEIDLDAELVVPPEPSWTRQPLNVTVTVRNLTSRTLAAVLDDPELETLFQGPIGVDARATGTADDMALDVTLSTGAGTADLSAQVHDRTRWKAQLSASAFELSRLRADLPRHRIDGRLVLGADARDTARIPVELSVRQATLDGARLPDIDATATVTPGALEELDATVREGSSSVTVGGRAGFDGTANVAISARIYRDALAALEQIVGDTIPVDAALSADLELAIDREQRLDVRGRVAGRHVVVPGAKVDQVDGVVEVTGSPSAPTGRVRVSARGAIVNEQRIDRAEIVVTGGPNEYEVEVEGAAPEASVAAKMNVGRGNGRVTLAGRARGKLQGQDWAVEIASTEASFAGEVRTEGIELTVAGQRVALEGHFSPQGSSLVLDSAPIDLAKVAPALGLEEPVTGTATLAGRLAGTPAVPRLELRLTGKHVTVGERPAVDLQAEIHFDAGGGELDGDLQLQASGTEVTPNPVDARAHLAHRFEGGAGWQQRLDAGEVAAEVELGRVDSDFVAAWLDEELPVSGYLRGRLAASGPLQDPRLEARLKVAASAFSRDLEAEIDLDYARNSAAVTAEVEDQRGRWIDLDAALELGATEPASLEERIEDLRRAADAGRWHVHVTLRERDLADFAALPGLEGRTLPPAAVAAQLRLDHRPGGEPHGRLTVDARQTRSYAVYGNCEGSGTRLRLRSELADGRLRAELSADGRGRQLLESRAEAAVALRPGLTGSAPELGPVHARLHATDLRLESLPFLCTIAQGTVSASAAIDDPLGPQPRAQARVTARGFSLGATETVDVDLSTRANGSELVARGSVGADAQRSTLDFRVPISWRDGHLAMERAAPVSAEVVLRDLPLAPFLDPRGEVSYVSGTLDGSARATGSIQDPQLDGQIALHNVAFTATDLAQPLRDVKGTVRFADHQILLEGFEAHDKRGVFRLNATASYSDPSNVAVDAHVEAERFPLRQLGQVVATADVDAKVRTTITPDQTRVEINLRAVDLWIENAKLRRGIALERHPEFVVDGVPASSEPEPAASGSGPEAPSDGASTTPPTMPVRTTILLRADRVVWIKRSDFAAKLAADLTAEVAGEQMRIRGRVDIDRGYLQLFGKVFDIDREGYLEFTGAATPDPVVSITAVHQNRRSGQDVTVTITGRGSAPELAFRVNDERVTAGQAFQAIYGARGANEDPADAGDQARAFVGGLTAGLLATTARKEFGSAAPILMIEPGERSSEGRVRAGMEFDSLVPKFLRNVVTGVYFEGILANESHGSERTIERSDARVEAGALLEMYFPDRFFAAGQYGPGATWSIDLGWQL